MASTPIQTALPTQTTQKPKRSPKTLLVAYTAFAACALGYGGFLAVIFALKAEVISTAMAITVGGVFAIVGEVGLWVGAASLGLSLYTRRKEKLARFFSSVRKSFKGEG